MVLTVPTSHAAPLAHDMKQIAHLGVGFMGLLGESHCAVFRLENIQTILSTTTPHIKPLIVRSKITAGKDQEPWSPYMKRAYNLTGKASNVARTSKVPETKLGGWSTGMRRPMAKINKIAATTLTDTNVMILLFIFLWLLLVVMRPFPQLYIYIGQLPWSPIPRIGRSQALSALAGIGLVCTIFSGSVRNFRTAERLRMSACH